MRQLERTRIIESHVERAEELALSAKFSGAIAAVFKMRFEIPGLLAAQFTVEIGGYVFELTLICVIGLIHEALLAMEGRAPVR